MDYLLTMTPHELEEVLINDIGIRKIGHRKRIKALFAVRSVVKKDGKQDGRNEQDCKKNSLGKTAKCRFFITVSKLFPFHSIV